MNSDLHLVDTGKTVGGRAVFKLKRALRYEFEAKWLRLHVPAGFETDFATVPWLFWWIFPPTGEYRLAAVIHDWLYTEEANCCRFLADAIFRDCMHHLKVPLWKRLLLYYGVRIGGWTAYRLR